ncbi:MAG: hypothetical protein JXB45_03165 [Candidatus Krumholzibacteriota bacterium]|nr:hypothetical protein [Candidatus Krumholzibacteriota bacterium]
MIRGVFYLKPRKGLIPGLFLLLSLSVPLSPAGAYQSPFCEEPERYDGEYHLDMLTLRPDREWRELWEGRDNAFRLGFGSLNVEQWVLRESLKFSTPLSRRFRFRYWMDQNHTLDEGDRPRNEIEVEYNLIRTWYLSLLVGPAFWKRENDIGLGLQRRTAIDRYIRLLVKAHDFANNFAYRHGDHIQEEENLFLSHPFELILEAREEAGHGLRFGAQASLTNRWEKEHRFLDQSQDNYTEAGRSRHLFIWLERRISSTLLVEFEAKTAAFQEKRGETGDFNKKYRLREFLPCLWWYPRGDSRTVPASPRMNTKDHPTAAPQEEALPGFGKPSFSLRAGMRIRRERYTERSDQSSDFRKEELLPFILMRVPVLDRHLLEIGYLGDRYRSAREGSRSRTDSRWENRLQLGGEIRFRGESRLRILETVDLDREDWGQFSVHDHFFLALFLVF